MKKIAHCHLKLILSNNIIKTPSLTEKQCHCHQITNQAAAEAERAAFHWSVDVKNISSFFATFWHVD